MGTENRRSPIARALRPVWRRMPARSPVGHSFHRHPGPTYRNSFACFENSANVRLSGTGDDPLLSRVYDPKVRMQDNFLWKGRLGPINLRISDTTFRPTTISTLVAREIRIKEGDVAIDVGCGSGILAIIAAKLGARHVYAIDKSPDVIEVGRMNAEANQVSDRISFFQGDLFEPLDQNVKADVIIGDVSGIPDSLADESGWFPTKGGGGARGSELPIRMLQEARRRLSSGGRLLLPTGSLQDENSIIETAKSLYSRVLKLAERRIPLPSRIASSQVLSDLMERGVVRVTTRGSRAVWEARVWEVSGVA